MTFLSRRKRRITPRAARARLARKITSAIIVGLLTLASAHAQSSNAQIITPKFVPALPRSSPGVVPASYSAAQPAPAVQVNAQPSRVAEAREEPFQAFRIDLPGPQRMFQRDSEAQFFERIALETRKQRAGARAVFPEEPILSKEPYQPRNSPRLEKLVEPSYVCHGRLYFEQPNFERAGYDFGPLQPALGLGVFYYDTFLLPYHFWTDLKDRTECNVGKCLPGDPSPLLVPRERFSVTGLVGQSGAMIGLGFLFP